MLWAIDWNFAVLPPAFWTSAEMPAAFMAGVCWGASLVV
jgi:hypothetical protein